VTLGTHFLRTLLTFSCRLPSAGRQRPQSASTRGTGGGELAEGLGRAREGKSLSPVVHVSLVELSGM